MTDLLRSDDRIGIVSHAGSEEVVLPSTSGDNKTKIKTAIDDLSSGGGTAMGSGMTLAYQELDKGFIGGGINRVIVCSDGDANIGSDLTFEQILTTIANKVNQGVTMTTIGASEWAITRIR